MPTFLQQFEALYKVNNHDLFNSQPYPLESSEIEPLIKMWREPLPQQLQLHINPFHAAMF
jgi:hypothetical protein